MSNEELLDLDPADLSDIARQCYQAELSTRKLQRKRGSAPAPVVPREVETPVPEDIEEPVVVGEYLYLSNARQDRALLNAARIPNFLMNEHGAHYTPGQQLRLIVPAKFEEQELEV